LRAIDVHVHPMDQAYVEASMPAAQRMFKGKFAARPHKANVSIDVSGWGPKYIPASKHDMQRRLQDKVLFGSDYPGWSPGECCDEWEMEGFRPGVIEKLFYQKATRILKSERAVARATAAPP
jgi:predicted TIM-barrel fold metal-dependent hydrolase